MDDFGPALVTLSCLPGWLKELIRQAVLMSNTLAEMLKDPKNYQMPVTNDPDFEEAVYWVNYFHAFLLDAVKCPQAHNILLPYDDPNDMAKFGRSLDCRGAIIDFEATTDHKDVKVEPMWTDINVMQYTSGPYAEFLSSITTKIQQLVEFLGTMKKTLSTDEKLRFLKTIAMRDSKMAECFSTTKSNILLLHCANAPVHDEYTEHFSSFLKQAGDWDLATTLWHTTQADDSHSVNEGKQTVAETKGTAADVGNGASESDLVTRNADLVHWCEKYHSEYGKVNHTSGQILDHFDIPTDAFLQLSKYHKKQHIVRSNTNQIRAAIHMLKQQDTTS